MAGCALSCRSTTPPAYYDFRLELDSVLKAGLSPRARPPTPPTSASPSTSRTTARYGGFEGTIPKGEYGGGTVMLWDEGTWEPIGDRTKKPRQKGDLKFTLNGKRMKGEWVLIHEGPHTRRSGDVRENWLLIKHRDRYATEAGRPDGKIHDQRRDWPRPRRHRQASSRGRKPPGGTPGTGVDQKRRSDPARLPPAAARDAGQRVPTANWSSRPSTTATAPSPRSPGRKCASTPATATTGPTGSTPSSPLSRITGSALIDGEIAALRMAAPTSPSCRKRSPPTSARLLPLRPARIRRRASKTCRSSSARKSCGSSLAGRESRTALSPDHVVGHGQDVFRAVRRAPGRRHRQIAQQPLSP